MEAACWYPKPVLPIYNAVRKVAFATLAKTVVNDEKKVSLIKIQTGHFWFLKVGNTVKSTGLLLVVENSLC